MNPQDCSRETFSPPLDESAPLPRWKVVVIVGWSALCVGYVGWRFFRYEFSDLVWYTYATVTQLRFTAAFWPLMATRLFHIFCVAMLIAGCASAGNLVLRLVRLADRSQQRDELREFLISLVTGMVVIGNAILGLGLLGVMEYWIFWLLVAAPIGIWVWSVTQTSRLRFGEWIKRKWQTGTSAPHSFAQSAGLGGFEKFLFALACAACSIYLIGSFMPPHEYDTLKYQLEGPKEYIQSGRVEFLPHNFYANMPSLMNMIYIWGMDVGCLGDVKKLLDGGDLFPHLMNWFLGMATSVATFSLARLFLNRRVAFLAATFFPLTPWNFFFSASAAVDLAVAFFTVIALTECLHFFASFERKALLRCGIAAGAAMSTKYTAALLLLVPIIVAIFITREARQRRRFKCCFIFAASAFLIMSPWLIRNWLSAGDPLFPFVSNFIQSNFWNADIQHAFWSEHTNLISYRLAENFSQFWPNLREGFLIVGTLIPLSIFFSIKKHYFRFLLLWCGTATTIWFVLMKPNWRFISLVVPCSCCLAVSVLEDLEGNRLSRICAQGALIVVTIVVFLSGDLLPSLYDVRNAWIFPPKANCWANFTGQITRNDFIELHMPAVAWINRNLPVNAKIIFIGEDRNYYTRRNVAYATPFGYSPIFEKLSFCHSSDEVEAVLREGEVTHVYVNYYNFFWLSGRFGYMKTFDWFALSEFLDRKTRLVHSAPTSDPRAIGYAGGSIYEINLSKDSK